MFVSANKSTAQTPKMSALPLKLVIQAKYIGAIIGHGGSTIREIEKASQAKCMIDVHGPIHDEKGNQENIVLITGSADSCSKACLKMLQVVHGEMERDRGINIDVELKIRVINELVGRLIGKGGSSVKSIMEETGATVTINKMLRNTGFSDPRNVDYSYYPIVSMETAKMDRTVIIRGSSLDVVSNAERKISEKLHSFYEMDMLNKRAYSINGRAGNNRSKMSAVLPMPSPLIFVNSPTNMYDSRPNSYGFSGSPLASCTTPSCVMFSQQSFGYGPPVSPKMSVMPMPTYLKSRIYVPSSFIGSLIGSKGSYIRTMMQFTGATINIESNDKKQRKSDKKQEKTKDDSSKDTADKTATEEGQNMLKKSAGGDATESTTPVKTEKNLEKSESKSTENKKSAKTSPRKKKSYGSFGVSNDDRCVFINGYDFQVYKAEYFIYKRIADSSHCYLDELVLNTETIVPNKIVGRIVGKNGRNLMELQSMTQTRVQVQDRESGKSQETSKDIETGAQPSETAIGVTGSFTSLQAVQARFCALISETELHDDNDKVRSSASGLNYPPIMIADTSEMNMA